MIDAAWEGALAVSIHAPRVGSDPAGRVVVQHPKQFQSTLPVWGATPSCAAWKAWNYCFNPRSPCGERLSYSYQR